MMVVNLPAMVGIIHCYVSPIVRDERQPILTMRPPDGGIADVDHQKHHCHCHECGNEPENDHH